MNRPATVSATVSDVCQAIGADLDGDPDFQVEALAPLHRAGPRELSFLIDNRPPPAKNTLQVGALIIQRGLTRESFPDTTTLLRVDNAYVAFALAIDFLYPEQAVAPRVSAAAHVHPEAHVAATASLAPGVNVDAGATIGDRCSLHSNVSIGRNCQIGADCVLHPNVTIYSNTVLGDRCVIHAGAVIGADGFGFAPSPQGIRKIRHVGRAILGNDVEVGANSTVDRGVLDDTILGDGCKLDNLVHVGHNVEIGQHSIIAAQTGLAGSSRIGSRVMLGGQVGVGGRYQIGDGAQVGGRSAVTADLEPGKQYFGTPAVELPRARKALAIIPRLPEMRQLLNSLAERIGRIEVRQLEAQQRELQQRENPQDD